MRVQRLLKDIINGFPYLPLIAASELLGKMRRSLHDIYNGQTTTKANYYYSPGSMHGKQPSFLSHLKDPEQYKVAVSEVQEHEFKFYFIPASVERSARKKQ